jgi:hypothetical protein
MAHGIHSDPSGGADGDLATALMVDIAAEVV